MEIIEKDFKLKSINEYSPHFDLELLCTIKPRGGEVRQEFKNVAYGVNLDYAIKKIIHYRIESRHKEEAIDLKTYFNEFKKEINNFKELLNGNI